MTGNMRDDCAASALSNYKGYQGVEAGGQTLISFRLRNSLAYQTMAGSRFSSGPEL